MPGAERRRGELLQAMGIQQALPCPRDHPPLRPDHRLLQGGVSACLLQTLRQESFSPYSTSSVGCFRLHYPLPACGPTPPQCSLLCLPTQPWPPVSRPDPGGTQEETADPLPASPLACLPHPPTPTSTCARAWPRRLAPPTAHSPCKAARGRAP